MSDPEDLLWHGRRLCSALHRAWEAERRVAELEAGIGAFLAVSGDAWTDEGVARLHRGRAALGALAGVTVQGVLPEASRMPQDEPEPPPTPEAVPDPLDASGGIVGAPCPICGKLGCVCVAFWLDP